MKKSGGFTLMEILLAVALIGVVALAFAFLYSSTQQYLVQSVNFAGSQSEAALALEHMRRHLLRATDEEGGDLVVGNNGSQLTFTEKTALEGPFPRSRYELAGGGRLRFISNIDNPGSVEEVAQGITGVRFQRASETTLTLEVTSVQGAGANARSIRFQTAIAPRSFFGEGAQ